MEFATWEKVLLAILVVGTTVSFAWRMLPSIRAIRAGKTDRVRTDQIGRRLWVSFKEVMLQTRVISGRPIAGSLHAVVFGGFVFFSLETTDHFLKPYGVHFIESLLGPSGLAAYKAILIVWAVGVSIAIVALAYRRFFMPKYSPDTKSYSSGWVAALIFFLMATYLYSQGAPPEGLAKANWWAHALMIIVFPHLIVSSKHLHILMAPINIFFRTERLADLQTLNLDLEALEEEMEEGEEPSFGLETVGNLSWKQRMDFLSCVECRRCTDNCPANLAGQDLDPRGFILDGRKSILDLADDQSVIGNVISEQALGQCTSCGACEAACPVGIEHLQVLTGAKRAQALSLGTGMVASKFLETVERKGNPFGERADMRKKLIEELEIPYYKAGETEYLMWMGCVWGYNNDAKSSLEAMLKILRAANISFGVLKKESCSGHHSRRQGEEMQFQTLAGENIERLKKEKVEKMIAPCPHCLHTIGREYGTLDEEFRPNVIHHSQFIQELQARGKLKLDPEKHNGVKTTYHDPCYLGRYEGEFDAPRDLIRAAGLEVDEMDRSKRKAVCCGGGSAGFMSQTEEEVRVDQIRKQHVRDTGAKLLVTGCPECKMMLTAATDMTKDVAEVVAEALVD